MAAFRVESEGVEIARGTTIGANRLLSFEAVKTRRLEVIFEDSDGTPTLAGLQLYNVPSEVELVAGETEFLDAQMIEIRARNDRYAQVHYTLDGSEPNLNAPLATQPITLSKSCTLRARAYDQGRAAPRELRVEFRRIDPKDLRQATQFFRAPDPGLAYAAFEGGWQTLDQMAEREPKITGSIAAPSLMPLPRDEMAALAFTGWIQVPRDGIYTFSTSSDDGSRFYIGEQRVVENDGLHGPEIRSGRIGLQEGWHPVRIEYFNARGGKSLSLQWAGPGFALAPIPSSVWAH